MSEEMTRKEVIWQLKGLLLGELRTTTKERKALEYAISSLETDEAYQLEYESTTKNLGVDCISRADAIRVASGYCHPSNVAKELAKLPSVTPQEPKTGHWIKPTFDMVHNHVCGSCEFICSSCNKIAVDEYDYCPNCGARMVEPQESEDKE